MDTTRRIALIITATRRLEESVAILPYFWDAAQGTLKGTAI
jgi:hypothetical protein